MVRDYLGIKPQALLTNYDEVTVTNWQRFKCYHRLSAFRLDEVELMVRGALNAVNLLGYIYKHPHPQWRKSPKVLEYARHDWLGIQHRPLINIQAV